MSSNERPAPLFIPLKREYFEAFERGEKIEEFRPYGKRWNEETCRLGRQVVLSLGYGKSRRLFGRVVGFRKDEQPQRMPAWVHCYGDKHDVAACIMIELQPFNMSAVLHEIERLESLPNLAPETAALLKMAKEAQRTGKLPDLSGQTSCQECGGIGGRFTGDPCHGTEGWEPCGCGRMPVTERA